jgi:hypothetical protein
MTALHVFNGVRRYGDPHRSLKNKGASGILIHVNPISSELTMEGLLRFPLIPAGRLGEPGDIAGCGVSCGRRSELHHGFDTIDQRRTPYGLSKETKDDEF